MKPKRKTALKKAIWKKRKIQTRPKSLALYESYSGKIVWVNKSNMPQTPFRFGGVNKRGYMKDVHFKNKKEAIKYMKEYMKKYK